MRTFGLTGGIASGKSTVGKMLRDLGAALVDADQLAREVVSPGSLGLKRIAQCFGSEVLDKEGALDRQALGSIVFSTPSAREKLNAIIHPLIHELGQTRLSTLEQEGTAIAFYEAALLVENGVHKQFDGLVVVYVSEEIQLQRLRERNGLSQKEAQDRIDSQLPLREKLLVATHSIDNSGSLEETRELVTRFWESLESGDQ